LIEAATGALFVVTTFIAGLDIYLLFIISSLIIVFFIDLKYGIIPFKIVVLSLAVITVRYFFLSLTDSGYIFNYLFSGVGVFVLFLLLFLATRGRGIGFGDVVFSLLMGYLLGFPKIILGVYISFLTGAIISLILVAARRKKLRGGIIPFGPFLVLGTVVSLFWGQVIIDRLLLYFHVF
jgi:leader peptidase (prepilin peptidase)/N-methyltransferase